MKDPREYETLKKWLESFGKVGLCYHDRGRELAAHREICAILCAKDVEIDALREAVRGISDNRAELAKALEDIRDKACEALEWPSWQAKWCAETRKQRGEE